MNIVLNVELTPEALTLFIEELQVLKDCQSDFIPTKSGKEPQYNAAMKTQKVILQNHDSKISFYKQANTQETLDLMEDE